MPIKYLVPCTSCGQKQPIEANLSGLQATCACGARFTVPTLRELKELDREGDVGATQAEVESWPIHRAVILMGVLLILIGAITGGYLYANPPIEPPPTSAGYEMITDFSKVRLAESIPIWDELLDGLMPNIDLPAHKAYQKVARDHKQWMGLSMAAACLGLVVIGAGMMMSAPNQPAASEEASRVAS